MPGQARLGADPGTSKAGTSPGTGRCFRYVKCNAPATSRNRGHHGNTTTRPDRRNRDRSPAGRAWPLRACAADGLDGACRADPRYHLVRVFPQLSFGEATPRPRHPDISGRRPMPHHSCRIAAFARPGCDNLACRSRGVGRNWQVASGVIFVGVLRELRL